MMKMGRERREMREEVGMGLDGREGAWCLGFPAVPGALNPRPQRPQQPIKTPLRRTFKKAKRPVTSSAVNAKTTIAIDTAAIAYGLISRLFVRFVLFVRPHKEAAANRAGNRRAPLRQEAGELLLLFLHCRSQRRESALHVGLGAGVQQPPGLAETPSFTSCRQMKERSVSAPLLLG